MAQIPSTLRFAFDPSGAYKATKLYSWYPSDTQSEFDTSAFDVSRTGVATRVNSQGLIEVVPENVPRLDYSDGGSCPKLLTEADSKNYIKYSEDLSQSYWTKSGSSVSSGYNSPKGDNSAYEISGNAGSYILSELFSYASNRAVMSCYVKGVNGEYVRLRGVRDNYTEIITSSDFALNGEWQRIEFYVGYSATSTQSQFRLDLLNDNQNVLVWGIQWEALDNATSYIPNYGTSAGETRGADQVYGAGDSSTFNSVSGVFFADVKASDSSATQKRISMRDNAGSNQCYLRMDSDTIYGIVFNNSANQALMTTSYAQEIQNKYSIRYRDNDFSLWINGVKMVEDSSGSSFNSGALERISITEGSAFYGKSKSIQHYDYLTDDEMEVLTGYTSYQDIATQFGFKQL